jgi:hypothetical protein
MRDISLCSRSPLLASSICIGCVTGVSAGGLCMAGPLLPERLAAPL